MSMEFLQERLLKLTAVDATPLDGSTGGRTYKNADKLKTYFFGLQQGVDAVEITVDGTGSDGNTGVFNMYGYGVAGNRLAPEMGAAQRIFLAVTLTLGTAVAAANRLWAEHFEGTDLHTKTVGLYDNALAGNGIAKIALDTRGLTGLYIEPITFTTLTALCFHIRELKQY